MELKVKGHKVNLDGNKMSGDTYPVKSFIKSYLRGTWDANSKSWMVDLGQVSMWTGTCIQTVTATQAVVAQKTNNKGDGWCDKCQSWCYGDCTAND